MRSIHRLTVPRSPRSGSRTVARRSCSMTSPRCPSPAVPAAIASSASVSSSASICDISSLRRASEARIVAQLAGAAALQRDELFEQRRAAHASAHARLHRVRRRGRAAKREHAAADQDEHAQPDPQYVGHAE